MSSNDVLTPLQAFKDYVGIKLHFQGDFVWRPDMGGRLTEGTLTKRKDAHFFYSIPREYDGRQDFQEMLVSGFMWDRKFYIADRRSSELKDFHNDRMRRFASLYHTFESELDSIIEYAVDNRIRIGDLLDVTKRPAIIADARKIRGGVSSETMAVLDHYFGFCTDARSSDPLWAEKAFLISRYKYFCRPNSANNAKYERQIVKLIEETKER